MTLSLSIFQVSFEFHFHFTGSEWLEFSSAPAPKVSETSETITASVRVWSVTVFKWEASGAATLTKCETCAILSLFPICKYSLCTLVSSQYPRQEISASSISRPLIGQLSPSLISYWFKLTSKLSLLITEIKSFRAGAGTSHQRVLLTGLVMTE